MKEKNNLIHLAMEMVISFVSHKLTFGLKAQKWLTLTLTIPTTQRTVIKLITKANTVWPLPHELDSIHLLKKLQTQRSNTIRT